MAQRIKVLAVRTCALNLILKSHVVDKEEPTLPQLIFLKVNKRNNPFTQAGGKERIINNNNHPENKQKAPCPPGK